jgi:uncharacterized SAM-binding protein YcdF (DUF218 family)
MYNLFSALAYFFIAPENWIICLLLLVLFVKSVLVKKRLALVIVLLFFIFGNRFLYVTAVNAWQPSPVTLPGNATYEAGIVLGGATSFDIYKNGYFNGAADRFIEACILYKTGKVKRIIITGGSNKDNEPKDADFQYKKMLQMGVPAEDVIVEDSSRTTFENAVLTKEKIDSLRLKPPYVLVTSAMHIPRAERVFTKAGVPVIPFPCDYHVINSRLDFTDYIIPNLATFSSWSLFFKEVVGLMGYKMFGKA